MKFWCEICMNLIFVELLIHINMKYIHILPILFVSLLLASCSSTKKLYEEKQYDQVIQKVAPKVCSGVIREKEVNMVANAYHQANEADFERIQSLKASGKPDAWPEIYQRYKSMKGRNDALDCFPNKIKRGINYKHLALDEEIVSSRNKAESYLVAKSNLLLNSGEKADAIEAEKYIVQLRKTNPENQNIQDLRLKALLRTSDNILITFSNDNGYTLPEGFAAAVLGFDANELSNVKSNVDVVKRKGTDYNLVMRVKLLNISGTPERNDAVTYKEENNGKSVTVNDQTQSKSMTIKGKIEYYDKDNDRVRFAFPFEVTSKFSHDYGTISGDVAACSAETLELIKEKKLPFPTDGSMMMDAAAELNDLLAKQLCK